MVERTPQMKEKSSKFSLLENIKVTSETPQFTVGKRNGFLPRESVLETLPTEYETLEKILQEMPLIKSNGEPGLLAEGKLGDEVKNLPLYDLTKVTDSRLLSALFRDYTFLASAFLLEPCHLQYLKDKTYGLGRDVLPKNIAVPLSVLAEKLECYPFMEYALSYALYNYKVIDQSKSLEDFDNLQMIRRFEGGPHENGFVIVHVLMELYSGKLVESALNVIESATDRSREKLNASLESLYSVLCSINVAMETMWRHSTASSYNEFRTFIMGTKNQPMFPNGVIYEGVSNEPKFFRGESGANDSIIPLVDNLLQLTEKMPDNSLSAILRDFRSYRPKNHNKFLEYVEDTARELKIGEFAMEDSNTAVLYLANLDKVREFRARHWNFTKEYILKFSKHPVATGGSPIVTWLPNQLSAVLQAMEKVGSSIDRSLLSKENSKLFEEIVHHYEAQNEILAREVITLRKNYPGQDFTGSTGSLK